MRSIDSLDGTKRPHGTRSRYVSGCRCGECKEANRLAYHERQQRAKEAAAEITETKEGAPQQWTDPRTGKTYTRIYKRACPGVNGDPCEWGSHLRSDSKGSVCGRCRLKLTWNGLVPSDRARDHIHALSRRGVGYKQVADAAGVAESIVAKIRSGERKNIRAQAEKRILEVDIGARADHALVPAGPSWKLLNKLLKKYSKAELARRLGSEAKNPALQVSKKEVTVKKAHQIQKLYNDCMEEQKFIDTYVPICTRCGYSHKKPERLARLKRALPARAHDIRDWWPCTYGIHPDPVGERRLYRDLHDLGAVLVNGIWRL